MVTNIDSVRKILNNVSDQRPSLRIENNISVSNHVFSTYFLKRKLSGKNRRILMLTDYLADVFDEEVLEYVDDEAISPDAWSLLAYRYGKDDVESFLRYLDKRSEKIIVDAGDELKFVTLDSFLEYDYESVKSRINNLSDYRMVVLIDSVLRIPPVKEFVDFHLAYQQKVPLLDEMVERELLISPDALYRLTSAYS